jgi:hypothetical protein
MWWLSMQSSLQRWRRGMRGKRDDPKWMLYALPSRRSGVAVRTSNRNLLRSLFNTITVTL